MIFLCGFTNLTDAKKNDPAEWTTLVLLSPYIEKAIDEYYGDSVVFNYMGQPTVRQIAFYDAKVEYIRKLPFEINQSDFMYEIKVSVPTFHGAHNPPYANEVMTFIVNPGAEPKLINYESIKIYHEIT